VSVCCECCVLCDRLITRPEEYTKHCVSERDREASTVRRGGLGHLGGCRVMGSGGGGEKSQPSIRLLFYLSPANYMTQATRFDRSCSSGLHHNFCFWRDSPPPQWAMASSFTRFLDHTQRHTTVGRIPPDE